MSDGGFGRGSRCELPPLSSAERRWGGRQHRCRTDGPNKGTHNLCSRQRPLWHNQKARSLTIDHRRYPVSDTDAV